MSDTLTRFAAACCPAVRLRRVLQPRLLILTYSMAEMGRPHCTGEAPPAAIEPLQLGRTCCALEEPPHSHRRGCAAQRVGQPIRLYYAVVALAVPSSSLQIV